MKVDKILKSISIFAAIVSLGLESMSIKAMELDTKADKQPTVRQLIDQHGLNPELNLIEMRNLVEKAIVENDSFSPIRPYFELCRTFQSVSDLATISGLMDLPGNQRASLTIYMNILLSEKIEGSVYKRILKLGNLCSLFLSTELDSKVVALMADHKYGLINTAGT